MPPDLSVSGSAFYPLKTSPGVESSPPENVARGWSFSPPKNVVRGVKPLTNPENGLSGFRSFFGYFLEHLGPPKIPNFLRSRLRRSRSTFSFNWRVRAQKQGFRESVRLTLCLLSPLLSAPSELWRSFIHAFYVSNCQKLNFSPHAP